MKASDQNRISKQDYGTPPVLIEAVQNRLHFKFAWDLAASKENTVCPLYFDEAANSLVQDWHMINGWLWLNPPFEDIEPWVKKCYEESQAGAHVVCLVPLSVAEWWQNWVEEKAYVVMLHGRLTFVGAVKPYPKDCSLLVYTPFGFKGHEVWDWRE